MKRIQLGKKKRPKLTEVIKRRISSIDFDAPKARRLNVFLGRRKLIFIFLIFMSIVSFRSQIQEFVENATRGDAEFQVAQVAGVESELPKITEPRVKEKYKGVDVREYVFDEWFKLNNSPLAGQADLFVDACDRFGAPRDCITIVAITGHETNYCKYYISYQQNNCMGWGGAGPNRIVFPNMKAHIDTATDVLVNQYGIRFLLEPRLMQRTFCGPQAECDNWGNSVELKVSQIDQFAESLGVGRLTNLR